MPIKDTLGDLKVFDVNGNVLNVIPVSIEATETEEMGLTMPEYGVTLCVMGNNARRRRGLKPLRWKTLRKYSRRWWRYEV